MDLDQALLAEFLIHPVVVGQAIAAVPDLLDFAAHAIAAARAGDQAGHTIDDKWQHGKNPQHADTNAKAAPRVPMHQITEQEACRSAQQGRGGQGADFNPLGRDVQVSI